MADDAKLILELEDKTPGQAQQAGGFVGFASNTGIVSGLSNVHPFVAVARSCSSRSYVSYY